MIDADGVALAAIHGPYAMIKKKDAEIAALRAEVTGTRALEKRLEGVEKRLSTRLEARR